jgi:hypothetical protein
MKIRLIVLACVVGMTATACAGTQIPDKNYAPDQTIAAAEERGVDELPKAKLHLKLARDQFDQAQKLEKAGDDEKAKLKLMKAQADADYALSLLRREDEKKETEKVRKKLEKLRKEMNQQQATEE